MKDMLQYKAENYTIEYQKKKLWQRFVFAMAVVVVFCTTYALILPAITWEIEQNSIDLSLSEDGVYCCGMAAHTHSEENGCYDADGTLICNIPEHVHTEACLTESEEDNETSGALGVETDETGTGSDDETLTEEEYCCGLEAHIHSPGCYSPEDGSLICTIPEHIHTEACRNHPKEDDKTADVSEPEKTGTETDSADPAPAENDRSADVSEPEKTETGTDSADPPITKDDEIADALEKAFEGIGLPGIGDGDRVLDSGEVPEDTETSPEDTETSPEEPVLSSPVADVAKERKSFSLLTSGTPPPPDDPTYVEDDPVEVTLKKQIDWLGDNDVAHGGGAGTEDLYRLYLSLKTGMIEPMDLLLVIDQSGSMGECINADYYYFDIDLDDLENEGFEYDEDYEEWFYFDEEAGYALYYDDYFGLELVTDFGEDEEEWWDCEGYDKERGWYFRLGYGDTRQEALLEFLNGDEENNHSDGFINLFRNANPQNRLAVLSFSDDCSMTEDRYLMDWDDTALTIDPPDPDGATNYAAAFDIANRVLAEAEDSPNRKVMIFLSDGEPTLAYADGKMHRGFNEGVNGTSVIGTGNNYSLRTLCEYIDRFISYHVRDDMHEPLLVGTWEDAWDYDINGDTISYDDDGNPHSTIGHFIEPYSTSDMEHPAYIWPLTYDLTEMALNIPGTAFPEWDITDQTAYDQFVSEWENMTETEKTDWLKLHTQLGDGYNIFYLSESAFAEFSSYNIYVPVFTMFFSDDADGMLQDESTYRNEVLKYMSGDDHPDAEDDLDRYYHYQSIDSAEALANAIQSIVGLSNVKITDPLSEYVDVADVPQLEITLTNARYSDDSDYPYLYRNGAFTDLGELLLNTNATKIDILTKTLDVVFNPDILFTGIFECEASFNVIVNDHAYDTYAQSGYNAEGDPFTDYTGNATSSGKEGFYSNVPGVYSKDDPDDNEGAIAEWTYYGNDGDVYKKPVVQLRLTGIDLHKVAANNHTLGLNGAKFDIYRELATAEGSNKEYTDGEGTHYLKKVNSGDLVSGNNGTIEIEDLRAGQYYLFETRAPDGYFKLDKPVSFEVVSSVEDGEVKFEIVLDSSGDVSAALDPEDSLSLYVENLADRNLPITGGTGRYILYALGVLLIAGSLLCGFILRRKRERRDE